MVITLCDCDKWDVNEKIWKLWKFDWVDCRMGGGQAYNGNLNMEAGKPYLIIFIYAIVGLYWYGWEVVRVYRDRHKLSDILLQMD